MAFKILAINPGSTSTKVAIYEDRSCLSEVSYEHDQEILSLGIWEQYGERKRVIMKALSEADIPLSEINAIAARGGRVRPVPSGVYSVNNALLEDSKSSINGAHASSLAVFLGEDFAEVAKCPVYIVDPVSVDEMVPEARYSGTPLIMRKSLSHALNSKEVARKASLKLGMNYENLNLVVAHLGGGTTISAHKNGRMIDVINDFEGSFTPERSGGLPTLDLVSLCFSGKFSKDEVMRMIEGDGGFKAYLGTKNLKQIEEQILAGDEKSSLLMQAYLYQLTKTIGSIVAILNFKVDALCITGGIAKSQRICSALSDRFSKMTQVLFFPGSFEMEALALRVLNVMEGKERARVYPEGDFI